MKLHRLIAMSINSVITEEDARIETFIKHLMFSNATKKLKKKHLMKVQHDLIEYSLALTSHYVLKDTSSTT